MDVVHKLAEYAVAGIPFMAASFLLIALVGLWQEYRD